MVPDQAVPVSQPQAQAPIPAPDPAPTGAAAQPVAAQPIGTGGAAAGGDKPESGPVVPAQAVPASQPQAQAQAPISAPATAPTGAAVQPVAAQPVGTGRAAAGGDQPESGPDGSPRAMAPVQDGGAQVPQAVPVSIPLSPSRSVLDNLISRATRWPDARALPNHNHAEPCPTQQAPAPIVTVPPKVSQATDVVVPSRPRPKKGGRDGVLPPVTVTSSAAPSVPPAAQDADRAAIARPKKGGRNGVMPPVPSSAARSPPPAAQDADRATHVRPKKGGRNGVMPPSTARSPPPAAQNADPAAYVRASAVTLPQGIAAATTPVAQQVFCGPEPQTLHLLP